MNLDVYERWSRLEGDRASVGGTVVLGNGDAASGAMDRGRARRWCWCGCWCSKRRRSGTETGARLSKHADGVHAALLCGQGKVSGRAIKRGHGREAGGGAGERLLSASECCRVDGWLGWSSHGRCQCQCQCQCHTRTNRAGTRMLRANRKEPLDWPVSPPRRDPARPRPPCAPGLVLLSRLPILCTALLPPPCRLPAPIRFNFGAICYACPLQQRGRAERSKQARSHSSAKAPHLSPSRQRCMHPPGRTLPHRASGGLRCLEPMQTGVRASNE